jgi:hypothetical protein
MAKSAKTRETSQTPATPLRVAQSAPMIPSRATTQADAGEQVPERLRLDYEETGRQYRTLADMRFKLLAITPALLAAGLFAALGGSGAQKPEIQVGIGLFGFAVTFGLILYELRNTELYDAAVQRLEWLDVEIGFPPTRSAGAAGGVHGERPGREFRLLQAVPVFHDVGLALVYAASLGGWAYVFAHGAAAPIWSGLPFVVAIVVAFLVLSGFLWHDHLVDERVRMTGAPHKDTQRG